MPEVLLEFENEFTSRDGTRYEARVCGRERDDGTWEGWLEFDPKLGGTTIRTGRETTQPNRRLLHYWATGLTAGYIDGALLRTTSPLPEMRPRAARVPRPAYDEPAPAASASLPQVPRPARAVLDPFAVYAEGDHVLEGQLNALDEGQLRNIVRAYGLGAARWGTLESMTRAELSAHILVEVKTRVG